MSAESRELTRSEKTAIRKLVKNSCSKYDSEYGCLPLNCACYMLGKYWTGAYCKYFIEAVLPLDPALAASLVKGVSELRPCAFCGTLFYANGKQAYCTGACASKAHRKQKRESIRRKRNRL